MQTAWSTAQIAIGGVQVCAWLYLQHVLFKNEMLSPVLGDVLLDSTPWWTIVIEPSHTAVDLERWHVKQAALQDTSLHCRQHLAVVERSNKRQAISSSQKLVWDSPLEHEMTPCSVQLRSLQLLRTSARCMQCWQPSVMLACD